MNFNSWPDDIVTSIYVDEELHLFDLTPNTQNEGRYLGVQLFKYGAVPGTTYMNVKAYTTGDVLVATSSAITVASIPRDTDYFYGWFQFEFSPRLPMAASDTYRFKLALTNYTFSESTWIGIVRDWPTKMGFFTDSQIQASPIAGQLTGMV